MSENRNKFAANRQARSNPKAGYNLDKQLYSKMIDDAYNNILKDIGTFRATILQIKERIMVTESGSEKVGTVVTGLQPANFYEVIVRPEWLSSLPAPWDMGDFRFFDGGIIQGPEAIGAIECHPTARSVSPANNGATGEALAVGDIVICTFGEGPNNSGRFRDIRFEINSVGRDKDLIDAVGGGAAFSNLVKKVTGTLSNLKSGAANLFAAFTGKNCIDMAQSKYNKTPTGSTVSVTGNTCDPETLRWTGRAREGGKVLMKTDIKPRTATYIGSAVPSAQGKKIYNGIFVNPELFQEFSVSLATYKKDGTFTLGKPKKFKVLKDAYEDLINMNNQFKTEFGHDLPFKDLARSYYTQVGCKSKVKKKTTTDVQGKVVNTGGLKAAKPGYSNHGWGLAIDFYTGDKIYQKNGKTYFDSSTHIWLRENGWKYNWVNPKDLRPGNKKKDGTYGSGSRSWSEAWHFEWRWMSTVLKGYKDQTSWYEDKIPTEYKTR